MRLRSPSRPFMALALVAMASLALAACGGSDDDNGSSSNGSSSSDKADSSTATTGTKSAAPTGAASSVKLTAVEGGATPFSFSEKSPTAKAGKVTLTLANPSSNQAPHAIEVEGNGVEESGQVVSPGGGDSTVTVDLKPGKYEFYCPVDDHKAEGMEGTLTVQ